MIFLTYPRTGVHFIIEAIYQQTGIKLKHQHSFTPNKNTIHKNRVIDKTEDFIINIVRDPAESIASWLLLHQTLNNINYKECITHYIFIYKKLLQYNNVVFINYKDFNNINKLLVKLYEILGIVMLNENLDIEKINENIKKIDKYSISSKNNEQYGKVMIELKNMDLSECYDLYHKALEKCIKV